MKREKLAKSLSNDTAALKSNSSKTEDKQAHESSTLQSTNTRKLKEDNEILRSEITRMRKELDIKSIGDSMSRTLQLQEQNRRLSHENQRLREEINLRGMELGIHGASGYTKAQFVDRSKTMMTAEEKLELATVENKRVNEELGRLRAALEETHVTDTGSRFTDQRVTGQMIDTFRHAQSRKAKLTTAKEDKGRKAFRAKQTNETDDSKLMKSGDKKKV